GVEPVDTVVVAADAAGAGVLEAVDLVQRGAATRVAVFADPPDAANREFIRCGVPYDDAAARSARQFRSLGVPAIEHIPRAAAGTEAEARALRDWCKAQPVRAVIVVTMPDHSRRWRRIAHRTMYRQHTRVLVRPAHYSPFDPDRWWESRDGVRTAVWSSRSCWSTSCVTRFRDGRRHARWSGRSRRPLRRAPGTHAPLDLTGPGTRSASSGPGWPMTCSRSWR